MGRGRLSRGAQGKLNVTFGVAGLAADPGESTWSRNSPNSSRLTAKSSMNSVEPPFSGGYFRLERNASTPAL